jgi:hypothetical protein
MERVAGRDGRRQTFCVTFLVTCKTGSKDKPNNAKLENLPPTTSPCPVRGAGKSAASLDLGLCTAGESTQWSDEQAREGFLAGPRE